MELLQSHSLGNQEYFNWQQFTEYAQSKWQVRPQQIRILSSQLSFSLALELA